MINIESGPRPLGVVPGYNFVLEILRGATFGSEDYVIIRRCVGIAGIKFLRKTTMPRCTDRHEICAALFILAAWPCAAQVPEAKQSIKMQQYTAVVEEGNPPLIQIKRDGEMVFQFPAVAGLASETSQEHLSDITYSMQKTATGNYELNVSAKSSLWTNRRFQWRFFADHVEFQQFASGHGKLGRCYFLSNGVSNRWDNGTTDGHDMGYDDLCRPVFCGESQSRRSVRIQYCYAANPRLQRGPQRRLRRGFSSRADHRHLLAAATVPGISFEQNVDERWHWRET